MNKIARVLRAIARDLPKDRADKQKRDVSSYICDHVNQYKYETADAVERFLHSLGMGCGHFEFTRRTLTSDLSDAAYEDAQARRICWCLFAADLAEEWKQNER